MRQDAQETLARMQRMYNVVDGREYTLPPPYASVTKPALQEHVKGSWSVENADCRNKEHFKNPVLSTEEILSRFESLCKGLSEHQYEAVKLIFTTLPVWKECNPERAELLKPLYWSFPCLGLPISRTTQYCLDLLYGISSEMEFGGQAELALKTLGKTRLKDKAFRFLVVASLHHPESQATPSECDLNPDGGTEHHRLLYQMDVPNEQELLAVSLIASSLLFRREGMPKWNELTEVSPPPGDDDSDESKSVRIFVSHPWHRKDHPDPDGHDWNKLRQFIFVSITGSVRLYETLKILGCSSGQMMAVKKVGTLLPNSPQFITFGPFGEQMDDMSSRLALDIFQLVVHLKDRQHRLSLKDDSEPTISTRNFFLLVANHIFLWLDYSSMPQKPRLTDEEETRFKRSLRHLNVIQTSMHTLVVLHKGNSHSTRAWCVAERLNPAIVTDLDTPSPSLLGKMDEFWAPCFLLMISTEVLRTEDLLEELDLDITNKKEDSGAVFKVLWSAVVRVFETKTRLHPEISLMELFGAENSSSFVWTLGSGSSDLLVEYIHSITDSPQRDLGDYEDWWCMWRQRFEDDRKIATDESTTVTVSLQIDMAKIPFNRALICMANAVEVVQLSYPRGQQFRCEIRPSEAAILASSFSDSPAGPSSPMSKYPQLSQPISADTTMTNIVPVLFPPGAFMAKSDTDYVIRLPLHGLFQEQDDNEDIASEGEEDPMLNDEARRRFFAESLGFGGHVSEEVMKTYHREDMLHAKVRDFWNEELAKMMENLDLHSDDESMA